MQPAAAPLGRGRKDDASIGKPVDYPPTDVGLWSYCLLELSEPALSRPITQSVPAHCVIQDGSDVTPWPLVAPGAHVNGAGWKVRAR